MLSILNLLSEVVIATNLLLRLTNDILVIEPPYRVEGTGSSPTHKFRYTLHLNGRVTKKRVGAVCTYILPAHESIITLSIKRTRHSNRIKGQEQ